MWTRAVTAGLSTGLPAGLSTALVACATALAGATIAAADPEPAPEPPPSPTAEAPAAEAPAEGQPATAIEEDGTYRVGEQIAPGTYTSAGPAEDATCYRRRSRDGEIVDNAMTKSRRSCRSSRPTPSFGPADASRGIAARPSRPRPDSTRRRRRTNCVTTSANSIWARSCTAVGRCPGLINRAVRRRPAAGNRYSLANALR